MKSLKFKKRIVINVMIFLAILGFLSTAFFDQNPTFQTGAAKGTVVGVVLFMVIYFLATIIYTHKSGGGWKKVRANLKHNFIGLFSFTWKDLK